MQLSPEFIERVESTWQSRRSMYLDWCQLQRLLKHCLYKIIERDIWPAPEGTKESWFIPTIGYTEAEITKILNAANANRWERKYHTMQLDRERSRISTSLALKLIAKEFPFVIEKTIVVNGGVMFFGPKHAFIKDYKKGLDEDKENDVAVKVVHEGVEYEFQYGSQAYIFHTGIYNDIHERYGTKGLLEYVSVVHDCYLSDSNRTPLGALADYIAQHWRKIRKKGRHEILDEFYSHV